MQNFIIIILSISLASAQFSIVDKQIYNISDNMYYSENEFINLLNSDSNFANDKDFLNYKKYASRLNFKKSKYIYLFSLLSIFTGIDGIQNPEEHVDDDSPPGLKNIIVGCLLSSTYYGYNSVKKLNHYIKLFISTMKIMLMQNRITIINLKKNYLKSIILIAGIIVLLMGF